MVEPTYVSVIQAWLSPEEPAVVAPASPDADAVSSRLCLGCSEPLPPIRKSFHSKICQGRWLTTVHAARVKAAKAKKEAESA